MTGSRKSRRAGTLSSPGLPEKELQGLLDRLWSTSTWDDSSLRTAERVLDYWAEFRQDPLGLGPPELTTFEAYAQQLIVVKGIQFSSICCHHLLPFFGEVHVGYLPHTRMVGLSKIPRVVEYFSRRPQTQERMTANIADYLKKGLEAKAVGVVVQATHTCMVARGIRANGASMLTSEMRGIFLTSDRPRAEFLELIR